MSPDPTPSGVPAAKPTNSLAIVSLVLGIASYFGLPIVGAVAAIITGHIARGQIRDSGGIQGGEGMALAGLVLGYAHFILVCLAMAIITVFFGGLAAFLAAVNH